MQEGPLGQGEGAGAAGQRGGDRRRRLEAEDARILILDAAACIMRRDGYAAVSTRSVAREAGLKPPLVHYHFETTENLLLAFYRRSAERSEALLRQALASDDPLQALWDYNTDTERTVLAAEFLALANHRDAIRREMALNVERFRLMQAEGLHRLAAVRVGDGPPLGDGASVLIAAVARALVAEAAVGINTGHESLRRFVEAALQAIRAPTNDGSHKPIEPSRPPCLELAGSENSAVGDI